MLSWAIVFFILATIFAVLGYGGIASAFMGIAQVLFLVFAVLFALCFVVGAFRGAGRADG